MISFVFLLMAISAAIVAVVAAKRARGDALKAMEGDVVMSQRLEDLYRAATEAQIGPERAAEAGQSLRATTSVLGAPASEQSAVETPPQPSLDLDESRGVHGLQH